MEIIIFFISFFCLVFLGSLVINGWFSITRGYVEELPDGTKRRYGKIFKGWYFFWFRELDNKRDIFYKGDNVYKLCQQWKSISPAAANIVEYVYNGVHMNVIPDNSDIERCEAVLGVKFHVIPKTATSCLLQFYKEYPRYIFPEWARDVMAGCVTCHSSWLGSLVFWITLWIAQAHGVWTIRFDIATFITWVAYCICLAFTTTFLWNKNK